MITVLRWLKSGMVSCASALLLFFLIVAGQSYAADELVSFSNPEHKVMYQELLREYLLLQRLGRLSNCARRC